jgi:Pro-kumamolisin, activation domain/Carbohydrate binding module (family 6)
MIRKPSASLSVLAAVLLVATVSSQAQKQSLLTSHTRPAVASGQARLADRLPASQTMRLVLTLPLRNQEELDGLIEDLYNPSSSSYRQFLSVDEFTARFGPTQEDYDTLIAFARENGLTVAATSRNRVNLDVVGTVSQIEKAFNVKMGIYQHPTESRTFFAPDREPTVDLPFPLWHIAGLDNFSIPHPAGLERNSGRARSGATVGSGPSASFLGSDMRAAYYGGSLRGSGQSLGLLEFDGTDLADLTTYYKNIGQTNNVPVTLDSTDGTSTSCVDSRAGGNCDDTEQTLDMTQALGMAPGMSSLVVYVGSTDSAIFNAMATASPLNAQLSSSWTWSPADPNTANPYFQEFAAQGQNLFQAAGDSGKWTTSGTASEIFPADDVYVTSVGGTDLATKSGAGPWASETAWADSGGGISPDKYALPSWQTTAAAGCSSCSKTYRNGPDVSANANFTFYVCADQTTCTANEYGGTSFAAPMWAGYLALVNQQSVANGNKTVGFINPTLYSIGESSSYDSDFHDVTSGSNGFSATTGYDLATGWGSPNGSGLLNALAGSSTSPTPGFSLSASPGSVSIVQGNSGSSTITSTATGGFTGAVTLAASGAPAGVTITFNPSSIAGAGTSSISIAVATSVATGTYTMTVTGTSGANKETTTVSLTVTAPKSSGEGPFGGTPAAIPGTVMAENYDTGGQGVGYNVTSINGTNNGYRSDGVDLEKATSPATGNNLGWTASGQWFRYTVNVATAGTYKVSFLVAGDVAVTDAFHLSNSSGTNLSGSVNVPSTGGWQAWTTVTATVTLPAGVQTLTLNEDNPGWNIDSIAFASTSSGEGPFGGTPAAIPGKVMAENYDTGGQGVAYNVTSVNGTDNSYRSDGVDLETASAPATGNDLGWTAAGQWFKYTVNVATAGTYTVTFEVASPNGATDALHIANASGTNLTGSVNIPATGGWQTWTTVTATVTLPAGQQTLTFNQDNPGWNIDYATFAE